MQLNLWGAVIFAAVGLAAAIAAAMGYTELATILASIAGGGGFLPSALKAKAKD